MSGHSKNNSRNNGYVDIYSNSRNTAARGGASLSSYKTSGAKKFSNIIIIVLTVLLALGGSTIVYGNSILSSMYKPNTNGVTDEVKQDSNASITNNIVKDPMVLNIMLFGSDKRPDDSSNGNADSMILVSIDNRHKKLKMTSFMRDIYVYIPGHYSAKLNAAYSLGGPSLSIETIERNFGVDIDRYVVLYFDTFPQIIDTLGGVELTIDKDESEYLNHDFPYRKPSFSKGAGTYTLNGEEALDYSRIRYVGNNDFERTQRQRNVMTSLISEFKSADIPTVAKLMAKFLPEVATDITVNEMTGIANNSTKYMNYPSSQFRIPTDDNLRDADDPTAGAVLVIDNMNKAREDLARYIYEETVDPIYGSSSSSSSSATKSSSSAR